MKALVEPDAQKPGAVGDRVVALGKGIDPSRAYGESIGVARMGKRAVSSIVDAVGAAVTAGETGIYYEDVWSRMLQSGLVARAVDVRDLRWTEIDTPEDLARAEQLAASR
jgi:choline kinase